MEKRRIRIIDLLNIIAKDGIVPPRKKIYYRPYYGERIYEYDVFSDDYEDTEDNYAMPLIEEIFHLKRKFGIEYFLNEEIEIIEED